MSLRSLKPCRISSCTSLTRSGYCENHKKDEKKHKESKNWRWLYNSKNWKRVRSKVLLVSPFCVECSKDGIKTVANEVDHIKPHRGNIELFQDLTNLQALCKSCHSRKTMNELNLGKKTNKS